MGKLKFYTINKNYLDYLRENGDSKVPKHDYDNAKFYTGIVFEINNYSYFAPISSFKEQQKTNYLIYVQIMIVKLELKCLVLYVVVIWFQYLNNY